MVNMSKKVLSYQFFDFELLIDSEQLHHQHNRLKIEPQLFSLLVLFLSHGSNIVDRNTIEKEVWANRPVTDEAIRAAIKKLRLILNDDARSPRFIKTIPKQGYKWLAPTQAMFNENTPPQISNKQPTLQSLWLMVFVAVILLWWIGYEVSLHAAKTPSSHSVKVTKLTTLPGSEVFAHYHKPTNKLLFLHRQEKHSPQQLYTKDLTTNNVHRLSWDNGSYADSYWSNSGTKIAFNRLLEGLSTLHIVQLNTDNEVLSNAQLTHPELKNKFVIGWLKNDEGLLLAQEGQSQKPLSLYQFNFEHHSIAPISFPNVSGRGDYLGALSHDGTRLAILREVSPQQTSLIVMDQASGKMLTQTLLPFSPSRLTWQYDDRAIIASSFFGQSIRYQINSNQFEIEPTLPLNSNDIYASCGENCYILRQHNGNFLDLEERPIKSLASQNNLKQPASIMQSARLMNLPGAQDLPRYSFADDSVIFVSLIGQTSTITKLDKNNQSQPLASFNNKQISNLSISSSGKNISGIENGRLFYLSTDDKTLAQSTAHYLTNALEKVDNPVWFDEKKLYLTHFVGNKPSIILFDIQTQQRQHLISNMISFRPNLHDPQNGVGVDSSLLAWKLTLKEGKWTKQQPIVQLPSANLHRWQLHTNRLYYTYRQGRASFLCYTMTDQTPAMTPTCYSTGNNRFRLNFDIQPEKQQLLQVESLSAQSDIIKMNW